MDVIKSGLEEVLAGYDRPGS